MEAAPRGSCLLHYWADGKLTTADALPGISHSSLQIQFTAAEEDEGWSPS